MDISRRLLLGASQCAVSPSLFSSSPFHALKIGLLATAIPTVIGLSLLTRPGCLGCGGSRDQGFDLTAAGLLLGPAIGDWSAGLMGRGFARFGLRTLTGIGGLMAAFAACPDVCSNAAETAGVVAAIGSVAVTTGLAIWDLATVKSAVRRNRLRRVTVQPTFFPGSRSAGLVFTLSF